MKDAKGKKVATSIPVGATMDEVRAKLGPPRPAPAPTQEELKMWEDFGSAATDQQRVNVHLKEKATGRTIFWNAADVLIGDMRLSAEGVSARVPEPFAKAVSEGSRRFLGAAEAVIDWQRTRLYVTPGALAHDAYKNGIIIECRNSQCGTVTELKIEEVRLGRRLDCPRCDNDTPALWAKDMAAAAGELEDALAKAPAAFEAKLAIRTFDPPKHE